MATGALPREAWFADMLNCRMPDRREQAGHGRGILRIFWQVRGQDGSLEAEGLAVQH